MNIAGEDLRRRAARALERWSAGDSSAAHELLYDLAHGFTTPDGPGHEHVSPVEIARSSCMVILGTEVDLPEIRRPDALTPTGDAAWFVMTYLPSALPRIELGAAGLVCHLTPPPAPVDPESHRSALRLLLTRVRAERSMNERVFHRIIWAASEAGMPQREIAQLVEQPQTTVYRRLKAVEDDPELLKFGPRTLYDAHLAGRIDRGCFLELLAQYPYAEGRSADRDLGWSYLPNSWDELAQLALEGALTRDEYIEIVEKAELRAEAT